MRKNQRERNEGKAYLVIEEVTLEELGTDTPINLEILGQE